MRCTAPASFVCALLRQFRDRLRPQEVLVGAEVLHGLDVECGREVFGVGIAHALQGGDDSSPSVTAWVRLPRLVGTSSIKGELSS